jgi:hypothetical protein
MFAADRVYRVIGHRPPSRRAAALLMWLVALGSLLGKMPIDLDLF